MVRQMRTLHSEVITPCSPLDPRWQLVQRIAASQFFSRGPKLRGFLLYICENSLLGKPENLTAQLIGVRVFGRGPGYVPSEDNIVRVEAREMRRRLAAYFAEEGRDEPIVIEIPKGSYSPVFVPRELTQAESPVHATGSDSPEGVLPAGQRRWLTPVLAGALAVAIAVILWQALNSPFRQERDAFLAGLHQPVSASVDFSIYHDLLGQLGANPRRDALLVLSNPRIMTYFVSNSSTDPVDKPQISIRVPKALRNEFSPMLKERDRELPFQFIHVTRAGYTGIGEAVAALHAGRLMDLLGRRVHLTEGRFLNWDHVEKQDLILLGGPQSNDWSFEKDAKPNFSISANSIVNASPLPGEQATYRADASTDYALIQKLTTPYNFETVLLAGISSAGTAAAGEFLANPYKMEAVHKSIRAASPGGAFPPDWEVVIKVVVRDGLPLESLVIATRPVPSRTRK